MSVPCVSCAYLLVTGLVGFSMYKQSEKEHKILLLTFVVCPHMKINTAMLN